MEVSHTLVKSQRCSAIVGGTPHWSNLVCRDIKTLRDCRLNTFVYTMNISMHSHIF